MPNNSIILPSINLVVPDPYVGNVISLLDMESAADAVGNSVYLLGSASLTATNPKFGSKSALIPASSGIAIAPKSGIDFQPGSADFTWETHVVRPNNIGGVVFGNFRWRIGYRGGALLSVSTAGAISVNINNSTVGTSAAGAIPPDVWAHVALSRIGSNWYVHVEGAVALTFSFAGAVSNIDGSNGGALGGIDHVGDFHLGYYPADVTYASVLAGAKFDNARITKGTGRYSSAFVPPAAPFTL